MDTALMHYSSGDYKHHRIGNPNWSFHTTTNRTLYSHPSDNLLLASFLANKNIGGGGSFMSLPPPNVFRSPHNFQHRGQQPPLLPLPISIPRNNNQTMSINNIARSNSTTTTTNNNIRLSSTKINKNNVKNRGRDHSVTPKKSKSQKKDQKKDEPVGPDPKDLPKVDLISKVFSSSIINNIDKFSGSVVFTPSPPPSSLPLPTFSLRPKMSCSAQAAGVDNGATDSLRRLLRLP
uniref:uncharacterized protein LOC122585263 n=1 Tax=Erigeron canadensis TaxID=72917 RepID=UPI001CB94305|nr:uncharacterized protein LOC122585263 [Erigeron canadensis]